MLPQNLLATAGVRSRRSTAGFPRSIVPGLREGNVIALLENLRHPAALFLFDYAALISSRTQPRLSTRRMLQAKHHEEIAVVWMPANFSGSPVSVRL